MQCTVEFKHAGVKPLVANIELMWENFLSVVFMLTCDVMEQTWLFYLTLFVIFLKYNIDQHP